MTKKRVPDPPAIEPKVFTSPEEIDFAIKKMERRIQELDALNVADAITNDTGADDVVRSNIRDSIREIFGPNSPEHREHEHIRLWAGPMYMGMDRSEVIDGTERGRNQVRGILNGLISRLKEKREDLQVVTSVSPERSLEILNLHPRISDVASDLYTDGHHWEAVFAASKALINFVKEKSGQHDLDGADLMRKVFTRNNPILIFNDLSDQTDFDEQEGMMHFFEGVVLGIRNPGGHSFPEGSPQRATEYLSLISLLAYRVQESKRNSRT